MNDLLGEKITQRKRPNANFLHDNRYGGKDEWLTPPEIISALGEFDLDPCSPIKRPWPTAKTHFTIEDNGLLKEWFGRVWMNPPYGNETKQWMGRLRDHGNGIALIFARTETETWHEHIFGKADSIFFFRSRITFYSVSGKIGGYNGGAPSALIAYGRENAAKIDDAIIDGKLIGHHITY